MCGGGGKDLGGRASGRREEMKKEKDTQGMVPSRSALSLHATC